MPRPMSSQVIATQNQCSRRRKATRLRNNPPSSSRNSICRRRVSLEHRAGVSPGLSVLAWSRCLCASSVPDSSKTFFRFRKVPNQKRPPLRGSCLQGPGDAILAVEDLQLRLKKSPGPGLGQSSASESRPRRADGPGFHPLSSRNGESSHSQLST